MGITRRVAGGRLQGSNGGEEDRNYIYRIGSLGFDACRSEILMERKD